MTAPVALWRAWWQPGSSPPALTLACGHAGTGKVAGEGPTPADALAAALARRPFLPMPFPMPFPMPAHEEAHEEAGEGEGIGGELGAGILPPTPPQPLPDAFPPALPPAAIPWHLDPVRRDVMRARGRATREERAPEIARARNEALRRRILRKADAREARQLARGRERERPPTLPAPGALAAG